MTTVYALIYWNGANLNHKTTIIKFVKQNGIAGKFSIRKNDFCLPFVRWIMALHEKLNVTNQIIANELDTRVSFQLWRNELCDSFARNMAGTYMKNDKLIRRVRMEWPWKNSIELELWSYVHLISGLEKKNNWNKVITFRCRVVGSSIIRHGIDGCFFCVSGYKH